MRTKSYNTQQLCLFTAEVMAAMVEPVEPVKSVDLSAADPQWVVWQIEIGQSLKGREGRQHFRTLTQKRQSTRVVHMPQTELLARAG